MYLKRGIDKAVEAGVAKLLRDSKKVSDREEVRQVATVSANWDGEIGEIIADAMDKVGKDGTITVEEAKALRPHLMWLKVCNSIKATSAHTSALTTKQWKPHWRTAIFLFMRKK